MENVGERRAQHPPSGMTLSALEVRLVAYSDPLMAPMLADLSREYHARYHEFADEVDAMLRPRPGEFEPPSGGMLLLLLDGRPVAGGGFCRYDECTAEVKRVWTQAAHRRRGLARRLLTELEAEIRGRGYRRIYLTTGPRQPEARALYLATGYRPGYDPSLPPEQVGAHPFEKLI
jgi:GNAT superfamily N-acetyltransferase